MVWPPAIGIPAAVQTLSPPSRMRPMISTGSLSIGMPTRARAMIGVPPMAYTSLIALVAAMRPKSCGSSTMGMKKSVVAIRACWSLRRYTAASSLVSMPTSNSLGTGKPREPRRISERMPGAILQPQPPPWLKEVRRIGAAGASGEFIGSTFLVSVGAVRIDSRWGKQSGQAYRVTQASGIRRRATGKRQRNRGQW
jgi:hypothetical protein